MGKTYKRNDRWKKDRRDQNFKKSKKFKEFSHGISHTPKHSISILDEPSIETNENDSTLD